MTVTFAKPSRINNASRCTHRTAAGSRCRTLTSSASGVPGHGTQNLCAAHAKTDLALREADDLAATLTAGLDEFTSAAPINQFLSRLLLLLAQDRISPRRGAVMAYTANLILRTVTVMQQDTEKEPVHIEYVIGIPRPGDDETPLPEQTAACEPAPQARATASQ
jgi:hypothetical protein